MREDNYVKEFMDYYKRWEQIQKDITEIINHYENIDFYTNPSVDFELYTNTIAVKLNTGSIPFELINELNNYFNTDCQEISVSVGHHINLIYQFI